MTPRQLEIEDARRERPLVMSESDGRWRAVSASEARQDEIDRAKEKL